MCHGENRYGFFVEFDITNSCHLQLAFLEFYPFKEVKYVKSLSFTEFTPTLFYLLSHKLLILNNLQIPYLNFPVNDFLFCLFAEYILVHGNDFVVAE